MMVKKMKSKTISIHNEILKKIVPSRKEISETIQFSKKLSKKLERRLKNTGYEVEVRVEGSVAKETWLANEKDIDLFILIPKKYGMKYLTEMISVVKTFVGKNYQEIYAEHPYLHAEIEGFEVDIVPCFKLEEGNEVISSVDRTPIHTIYIKRKLNLQIRNQIRLLKMFMKGIGVYGAEIKVGGFSGYLCELLILYFEGFSNLLNKASFWKIQPIIDLEGHYQKSEENIHKIFKEPLIVIDPVDKRRNVASPVIIENLNTFIAASREFLKKPDQSFFYPKTINALSIDDIFLEIKSRGTFFVFIKTKALKVVADVAWGQIYKSKRAIKKTIIRFGFTILNDYVYSDEKKCLIFVFELQSLSLPLVKKHQGPSVDKKFESERFLKKHISSTLTLSGPRIEQEKWIVEKKREYTNVVNLLKDKLIDKKEEVGISNLVSQALIKNLEILVNFEVKKIFLENTDFTLFITKCLRGKPSWLKY
jgi:tRNA nucleotidyltransferase (CCA-adding enzyme)